MYIIGSMAEGSSKCELWAGSTGQALQWWWRVIASANFGGLSTLPLSSLPFSTIRQKIVTTGRSVYGVKAQQIEGPRELPGYERHEVRSTEPDRPAGRSVRKGWTAI